MPNKYKLILAYDGTRYSGWQIQPNGLSIQEIVQEKVSILIREPAAIVGAGRTDARVHARGQVAHFTAKTPLDLHRFLHSLNALLPDDIRVWHASQVPLDFHARFSATGKIYHYHLHLGRVESPFNRLYSWHLFQKIDLSLLEKAAQCFVGTHDFSAFVNESDRGSVAYNPVRTIYSIQVVPQEGGVRLEFHGNGFMYKMVRNIVGLIVNVALGKRQLEEIPQLFVRKDRQLVGKGAPAHGLFLMQVLY
ncbi:MAG: tRNA pseudouridine(38-40) synthase TruA [Parachlamydiaceae bacterium]